MLQQITRLPVTAFKVGTFAVPGRYLHLALHDGRMSLLVPPLASRLSLTKTWWRSQ